jgi:hypothetical protein
MLAVLARLTPRKRSCFSVLETLTQRTDQNALLAAPASESLVATYVTIAVPTEFQLKLKQR